MIRLAFCDDDPAVLKELQDLLDGYCAERGCEMQYTAFHNPLDLLAEIERGISFDVLFLDVLMPGENGMEAAAEIRTYDRNVKIIFLTSSSEYAVQSYTVGAYYYQLKPVWKDSFYRLLDSVLSTMEKEQSHSLILHCKSGINKVDLHQLEYCEVFRRTLFFHLNGGTVLTCSGNMDELCRQLKSYGNFLRPHRSYIINLDYVKKISACVVTMSDLAEIPIPRGKYNEVKDAFLEYAFQNRQVLV